LLTRFSGCRNLSAGQSDIFKADGEQLKKKLLEKMQLRLNESEDFPVLILF
jgi:hypothetical protein